MIVLLQQLLDVRLPVQDFPAKLDIGNPPLVPVILQAPAADPQRSGKLPVSQEPFPVEGRTVVTGKMLHFFLHVVQQGKEPADTFVLLVDNAFHLFRSLKVSVLSSFSHLLLLASDADVDHQLLHILWLVIELALEAGERQPSELFKIAFIITFAVHLDYVGEDINKLKNALLLCVHGGVPALLVILTGDLGSALVFVSIFIGMMFASGLAARYFAAAGAVILAAVPVLWFAFFSDFQKGRILAVYAPSKLDTALYKKYIFQQQQSVNAIGSGRFFGRGFLKGAYTQSHSVPVNDSDMIFSVIGEELGFVGAFAALALIALIIVKIVFVGKQANTNMGSLICYGTAVMIGSQAIMNIGMCLKLLPCIGITLPFFSSGGSSNLCIYIAIGLVMSIYRCSQRGEVTNFRYNRISTPFN